MHIAQYTVVWKTDENKTNWKIITSKQYFCIEKLKYILLYLLYSSNYKKVNYTLYDSLNPTLSCLL